MEQKLRFYTKWKLSFNPGWNHSNRTKNWNWQSWIELNSILHFNSFTLSNKINKYKLRRNELKFCYFQILNKCMKLFEYPKLFRWNSELHKSRKIMGAWTSSGHCQWIFVLSFFRAEKERRNRKTENRAPPSSPTQNQIRSKSFSERSALFKIELFGEKKLPTSARRKVVIFLMLKKYFRQPL